MAFLDRFSLDDLQRYSVWCRWALWIPAFIIVLLTFVSHKISERILVLQGAEKAKSQERQKLTEQQLAKARAQAEQANDRAEELEAKQSFEIGHDAEVTQGAKTSGQTLSKLEQAVDRLDGAISESSFQEGDNAAPMCLNALG